MASLFTHETLPADSEEAIREFDEKYLTAITAAAPPAWAAPFIYTVSSPRVTFPISLMSTKYNETKEQSSRFKTMAEKDFDLTVVEFDAGYEAKLLDILTNTFAYRNWGRAPSALADGEVKHVAKSLVTLLEDDAQTSPWDGELFFDTDHRSNPAEVIVETQGRKNTWSNYQSAAAAPTLANIAAEMTAMRDVRDHNGDKLGVEPNEIWLPTAKFQTVSDLLNQAFLSSGESNPMLGKIKPVHIPDLIDVNDWYLVDTTQFSKGVEPMVAAQYRDVGSLGLRTWDESSDFFKDTGKLKVSAHIWYGFKLVFPHAIRKVDGA
jgi:phage major head subunit gpT-like protein